MKKDYLLDNSHKCTLFLRDLFRDPINATSMSYEFGISYENLVFLNDRAKSFLNKFGAKADVIIRRQDNGTLMSKTEKLITVPGKYEYGTKTMFPKILVPGYKLKNGRIAYAYFQMWSCFTQYHHALKYDDGVEIEETFWTVEDLEKETERMFSNNGNKP